ncbi:hypothetical protein F441_04109 [Phytophthora nicotianae CJ01A1]|uniref:Uncharacterized protein n=1 Tax=Phytophthora nicotianae CJ01A1 TaxID=1317063 RepID=W2XJ22_PHYNI|nr:hypothetical protein F441_04109 [Phytophthora nicotianae CJ01A1]
MSLKSKLDRYPLGHHLVYLQHLARSSDVKELNRTNCGSFGLCLCIEGVHRAEHKVIPPSSLTGKDESGRLGAEKDPEQARKTER